ncbi:hypothetical protein CLOM_g618 [Closterium sp. NIES-68]|nr:hypothetical protein CLOM_g618 [Closterium sp. NIES-68]
MSGVGGGEEGERAGEKADGVAQGDTETLTAAEVKMEGASALAPVALTEAEAPAPAAKGGGEVGAKEAVTEGLPQEAAAAGAADRPSPWFSNLSVQQKVRVGKACKMLIDAGRLDWLQAKGLVAKYVEYTTVDVSPENRMLLASRANLG